jgi:hypothetical protein
MALLSGGTLGTATLPSAALPQRLVKVPVSAAPSLDQECDGYLGEPKSCGGRYSSVSNMCPTPLSAQLIYRPELRMGLFVAPTRQGKS